MRGRERAVDANLDQAHLLAPRDPLDGDVGVEHLADAREAIEQAVTLKVAEKAVEAYAQLAQKNNTMIVPGKSVAESIESARESGTTIRRKAEEIFDNSFVNNLEKSGFLKELWGSETYRR